MFGGGQRASQLQHTRNFWHPNIAQVFVAIVAVVALLLQLFAQQLGLPVWNVSENWQYPLLIIVGYVGAEVLGFCFDVLKNYFGLGREIRTGLTKDLEELDQMRSNLNAQGD